MADVLEIIDRDPPSGALASLAGFRVSDGGHVDSRVVIDNDNITPYCLDHATRRLIFADLPADLDLSAVPFAFSTQMSKARRLLAVAYDELEALAADVAAPNRMVFVFNSARSGSTLLHQIFNEVDDVVSFSELDFFGNLVSIAHNAADRMALADLLRWCIALFAAPYADRTVAFKFRSDCADVADVFHAAVPTAANIFLYRNAIDWSASWIRVHANDGWPEIVETAGFRSEALTRTGRTTEFDQVVPDAAAPSYIAMLPLWLTTIRAYQRDHAAGVPILAIRYEDLNEHRESMLRVVFDHAGIPGSQLSAALRGFDRDSQAGTLLQRTNDRANATRLDANQVAAIEQALADMADPLAPDIVLPGTTLPPAPCPPGNRESR